MSDRKYLDYDGVAYLWDAGMDKLHEHTDDDTVHVTAEEKERWADHLHTYVNGNGILIFYHDND